jgi:hypothetical protein
MVRSFFTKWKVRNQKVLLKKIELYTRGEHFNQVNPKVISTREQNKMIKGTDRHG